MSLSYGWLWFGILGCSGTDPVQCREGTELGSSGHCELPTADEGVEIGSEDANDDV